MDIPRVAWEADHEWHARRSFLESNQEFFTGDRLASLSMAWANWIFMGCNYGEQVQGMIVASFSNFLVIFKKNNSRKTSVVSHGVFFSVLLNFCVL